MNGMSLPARTVIKLMAGGIMMFGLYLLLHAHVSHGVGFAGGLIIGLAVILLVLANGRTTVQRMITSSRAAAVLKLGVAVLLAASVLGLFYGKAFLADVLGVYAGYGSAPYVLMLNIAISLITAGAIIIVFLLLASYRRD